MLTPKLLFTADGGKRRGKLLELKKDVDLGCVDSVPFTKACSSASNIVIIKPDWFNRFSQKRIGVCKILWFDDAIKDLAPAATTNYDLPAEHPSLYLYTSGTTGKPKGTIHTHAGAMSQIAKELGLVFDVRSCDRFFWLTDIGWMMGPWAMIGVLYWGGTLLMYDGAIDYPQPDRLWQFVAKHKINTLGISPTVIRVIKAQSENLLAKHDLSSLRLLGSVGEPVGL